MKMKIIGQNPYQLYGNGGIGALRGSSLGIGHNRPFRPKARMQGRLGQLDPAMTNGGAASLTFDDRVAQAENLLSQIPSGAIKDDFQRFFDQCMTQSQIPVQGQTIALTCLSGLIGAMTKYIQEGMPTGPSKKFPAGIVAIGVIGAVAAWALFA